MSEDGILRLWGKVRGLVASTPEDMAARSIQEVKTLLEQEKKSRIEENKEFRRKVKEQYDKNVQELAKQGRTDEASKKNLFVDGVYDRTEQNSALWFSTEAANDEEYDTRQLVGRLFLKVPLQDFFSLREGEGDMMDGIIMWIKLSLPQCDDEGQPTRPNEHRTLDSWKDELQASRNKLADQCAKLEVILNSKLQPVEQNMAQLVHVWEQSIKYVWYETVESYFVARFMHGERLETMLNDRKKFYRVIVIVPLKKVKRLVNRSRLQLPRPKLEDFAVTRAMEVEEQPDSDLESISSLTEGEKRIEEMISERWDSTGKLPTSPASARPTPRNTPSRLSTTSALAGRTTPSAFSPRPQRRSMTPSRDRNLRSFETELERVERVMPHLSTSDKRNLAQDLEEVLWKERDDYSQRDTPRVTPRRTRFEELNPRSPLPSRSSARPKPETSRVTEDELLFLGSRGDPNESFKRRFNLSKETSMSGGHSTGKWATRKTIHKDGRTVEEEYYAKGMEPYTNIPNVHLPPFYGNSLEFYKWWEMFKTLVDSDPRMPTIIKLNILQNSLKGNAFQMTKGLSFNPGSYDLLKRRLRDMYDNASSAIRALTDQARAYPRLGNNNLKDLSAFYGFAQEYVLQLVQYDDGSAFNPRAVQMELFSKLSPQLMVEYQRDLRIEKGQRRRFDAREELEWMLDWTGEQVKLSKLYEDADPDAKPIKMGIGSDGIVKLRKYGNEGSNQGSKNGNGNQEKRKSGAKATSTDAFATATNVRTEKKAQPAPKKAEGESPNPCVFCEGAHKTSTCRIDKEPQERFKQAMNHKLCLWCLRPGHFKTECRSGQPCKICDKNHNTLLHGNTGPFKKRTQEKKA